MGTSNPSTWSLGANANFAKDRQPVRSTSGARRDAGNGDLRERIGALETRAMTLLRTAIMNAGTSAAAHRSLAVVDAELRGLRAELAWHRADAESALHGRAPSRDPAAREDPTAPGPTRTPAAAT